jgi:predicted nuclease of predicted toxin-antitoxin system
MKFLVDAQLPRRLAKFLMSAGYDTIHTLDLPQANATPDLLINDISIRDKRVVITKDADFVESFLLEDKPYKLLLIATGNIKNAELERIFSQNIEQVAKLFEIYCYLELSRSEIVVHQ